MDAINFKDFFLYSLMFASLYYQQLHQRNFRGQLPVGGLLGLSASVGTIVAIFYVLYFGWKVSWTGAAILFVGGIPAAAFIGGILEWILGALFMSVSGFIVWPVCAYMLFRNV